MKTFLAETWSAHWRSSWLGQKCRNEITFRAKKNIIHHQQGQWKRVKKVVKWRFCARETALLELALV